MCELMAMSSRFATTVTILLEELAQRGGATGPHRDGWGIAYYDAQDIRVIREEEPAFNSEYIRFVKETGLQSNLIISHIRKATQGRRSLSNTQPFSRELGGQMHVFAHNGNLQDVFQHPELPLGMYRPIGTTDSEYAFCALLYRMQELWLASSRPSLEARINVIARFAKVIRRLGPANFIYSDGQTLFVHGHQRTQADGKIRPPGLFFLGRTCIHEPNMPTPIRVGNDVHQEVVLIASVPLSQERWVPFTEGELLVIKDGKILERKDCTT